MGDMARSEGIGNARNSDRASATVSGNTVSFKFERTMKRQRTPDGVHTPG